MAISSVDRVRTLLELTSTSKDALLGQILAGCEAAVEGYCKRVFAETIRTEFYSGTGAARLILNQYPVTDVDEVRVDLNGNYGETAGSFGSATILTAGLDYALEWSETSKSRTGFLRRLGGPGSAWGLWPGPVYAPGGLPSGGTLTLGRGGPVWLAVAGSIKVTYTAGFAAPAMPEDLKMAVDQVTCLVYRTGKFGGAYQQVSESLGAYAYSLAAAAIGTMPALGSPRQILARYRAVDQTI